MTRSATDPLTMLAAANPLPDRILSDSRIRAAAAAFHQEIITAATLQDRTTRSQPAPRIRVAALLAALFLVAMATTAGAYWLTARTGEHVQGPTTEQVVGEELIRLDAPDLQQVIDNLAAGYPLPPGMTTQTIGQRLATEEPTQMGEVGVESAIAFIAHCGWAQAWLDASAASDASATTTAGQVLIDAAEWPVFALVDGGGVVQGLREQAAAVHSGDTGPIERYTTLNC